VALLKGTRTVIAPTEGLTRVNPTGTPALATAGTGDALTGMVGGLLARGTGTLDAATAGAFLHGVAGRLAGRELGEGTLAGDVIERIPEAFAAVLA
jgi:NAD(P)H-hydrate epimerase